MTVASIITNEVADSILAPTSTAARLRSLDVLRGFALLGILVLNIQDFASPTGIIHDIPLDVVSMTSKHHALDVAIMTVQWLFFEGKMRALFAVLFGAGSVLLLDRMEHRGGARWAATIFHRRNMWLVLFGLIHGALIWEGDILLFYGSLALLTLYPLRQVRARHLICTGFLVSFLGGTLGHANAMNLASAFTSARLQEGARSAYLHGQQPTQEQSNAVTEALVKRRAELDALPPAIALGRRSYWQSEPANAKGELAFVTLVFSSGWVFEIVGLMIAGMGLYKCGFLSARLSSLTYVAIAGGGYAMSVPIVLIGLSHARHFGFSDAVTTLWMFLPYGLEQITCMLANASIILLLVKRGRLLQVQKALGAVGRTAFSNYILTSLLCQFVFKWGPWKLYGGLPYFKQIYVVIAVWTLNVIGSVVWLRFFAFGPLEWVWRSLTYLKFQPWRSRSAEV